MSRRHSVLSALCGIAMLAPSLALAGPWIESAGRPVWGAEHGLRFAIAPASVEPRGEGGPRGLIRIGYPVKPDGGVVLINYVAVEPVVRGRRGFSELETSSTDGKQGKIWSADAPEVRRAEGVEELWVRLHLERFQNGAHVSVLAVMRADRPGEVRLSVLREPDSAPIDQCVLTATMGNKARVRRIRLTDGELDSLTLYRDYRANGFGHDVIVPAARLPRDPDGGVFVRFTGDEAEPALVHPFPAQPHKWYYPGARVFQYWKAPDPAQRRDLKLRVNGRFVYWQSRQPIPGGPAFENIELRDRFQDGEAWIFGIAPGQ